MVFWIAISTAVSAGRRREKLADEYRIILPRHGEKSGKQPHLFSSLDNITIESKGCRHSVHLFLLH